MTVSRRARFMAAFILPSVLAATMLGGEALAQAEKPGEKAITISGGYFDDYLMLAVNKDGKTLSGYYNDGKCRFIFRDALSPTELYQRSDLGEAYAVDSWDPAHPDRHFSTQIYSKARDGYSSQLTLEPGDRDENRPKACRTRISLDRSSSISDAYYDVGVVRKPGAQVFKITRAGRKPTPAPPKDRLPPPGTGVWINRTYSAAFSPKGFASVAWYDPTGTPLGGYVRQGDLYPSQPRP
jgi:hypothetical protein